jgi:hypothetical protein
MSQWWSHLWVAKTQESYSGGHWFCPTEKTWREMHWSTSPRLTLPPYWNRTICFTFPSNENGNRWRHTASRVTPRIVNVLLISKKCWRWALASSEALPWNGLCCIMLMRAGLSLKLLSSMFISRPVLTLALDGADKSLMHLQASISAGLCGGGDPWNLSTTSRTWDLEDPGEESLERDFLIKYSRSKW